MRVLDEALASTPDDPALHARARAALRDSRAKRHRARRARRSRDAAERRARPATPTTARCATRWRCCYEDQDRNRKALDVLESLAEDNPDDAAILNALRLPPDRPVRPPRRGARLHRARARAEPRQPGDHRQHGLGALQARRLPRRARLPRARVSARAGSRDRGALGRRRAGSSASATARSSCCASRSRRTPTAATCKRSTSGSRHDWRGGSGAAGRGRCSAACASLPVGSDGLEPRRSGARRSTPSAPGKCAAGSPSTPATRAFQGSFNWRQQDDALELAVRGPLGATACCKSPGTPDALTVTARGETRTLTDPETELSELLGWWLPVASLPHWLLGFPDRGFRRRRRSRAPTARSRRSSSGSGASRIPTYQLAPIAGTGERSARAAPHRSDARRARAHAHDRRLATAEHELRLELKQRAPSTI